MTECTTEQLTLFILSDTASVEDLPDRSWL